ncbi:MAG TPA: hypothetical protein VK008_01200 [Sphingobacteriaceae bacterium]|nr:hypothetical protein [Sphingobacteriaceae bacterium]
MPRRLWAGDPSLWPAGEKQIKNNLGWLTLPQRSRLLLPAMARAHGELRQQGIEEIVLVGMGGSSLAAKVVAEAFPPPPGGPHVTVLDTALPQAAAQTAARAAGRRTLFIVASKSGTTLETMALAAYFQRAAGPSRGGPWMFHALTDPGSPLTGPRTDYLFDRIWPSPADVGGRYAALSPVGLLPAALAGISVEGLLDSGMAMAAAAGSSVPAPENPALQLAAALVKMHQGGQNKLTFLLSPGLAPLGWWLEQLLAESLGKDGRGLIPVVDEPPVPPDRYGRDRCFVHMAGWDGDPHYDLVTELERLGHPVIRFYVESPAALGGEFFRWEMAVAAAAAALAVNPFDQPDVEASKRLARRRLRPPFPLETAGPAPGIAGRAKGTGHALVGTDPARMAAALADFLDRADGHAYVALQAFLPADPPIIAALAGLRRLIVMRWGLATTAGWGPAYLHSTGQLHKGGPGIGCFIQLTCDPEPDLPVPGYPFTLGRLVTVQAATDGEVLASLGRPLLKLHLGPDPAATLRRLTDRLA